MLAPSGPQHFRTLFISDVHLGCKGCQAALLLDFLRFHDAETIYLVDTSQDMVEMFEDALRNAQQNL